MPANKPSIPLTKPLKKRGRKPATGPFATREELCREVCWYYANTSLSIQAIGHRYGLSQGAARKALDEGQRLVRETSPASPATSAAA